MSIFISDLFSNASLCCNWQLNWHSPVSACSRVQLVEQDLNWQMTPPVDKPTSPSLALLSLSVHPPSHQPNHPGAPPALVALSTGGGICLLRFCSTSWTWEPSVTGECQLSCQLQHKEAFEKRSEMKIDMVSPSTFDRDHRHGPEWLY